MRVASTANRPLAAPPGLLVDCYLNLHRPSFLSVRAAEGPHKGRVIAHVQAIRLAGCKFLVSESGRQRVIRDRSKNVHATIRGRVEASGSGGDAVRRFAKEAEAMSLQGGIPVAYNPYYTPLFINRETKSPVMAAVCVVAVGKAVIAKLD